MLRGYDPRSITGDVMTEYQQVQDRAAMSLENAAVHWEQIAASFKALRATAERTPGFTML